jgi:hypothetical protein
MDLLPLHKDGENKKIKEIKQQHLLIARTQPGSATRGHGARLKTSGATRRKTTVSYQNPSRRKQLGLDFLVPYWDRAVLELAVQALFGQTRSVRAAYDIDCRNN